MVKALGESCHPNICVYIKGFCTPSHADVGTLVSSFSKAAANYLSKYRKQELYIAYIQVIDLVETSQGAERQMSASIRNRMRAV